MAKKLTRIAITEELTKLGIQFEENEAYGSLLLKLKASEKSVETLGNAPVVPEIVPERLKSEEVVEEEKKVEEEYDYLRKYQYRKQTQFGSMASNPQLGSKAEKMKNILLTQPKVTTYIPRPENEDPSILLSVTLNGYRLDLPKEEYIVVPQQISDVIALSLKQTRRALSTGLLQNSRS